MPRPLGTTGAHGGCQYDPKRRPCRAVWLSRKHSRLGCSTTTAACMRVWWVSVRCKGMHCQRGSACSSSGAQGPFGITSGHLRRWFGFRTLLAFFWGGPRTRDPNGSHSGVRRSASGGIASTAQPMAVVMPMGCSATPPAIPVAGLGLAPFWHLFLAPQPHGPNGGHSGVRRGTTEGITNTAQPMAGGRRPAVVMRAHRAQDSGLPPSGWIRRGMGLEKFDSGPPCGLFRWPHRRCGRRGCRTAPGHRGGHGLSRHLCW